MSKNGASEAGIVFATWQTLGKSLKEWTKNHFDLIIVDEAHHTEADTYKPVVEYFTGPKLGITAVPDREDEADIRSVFGQEVINITLEEAIARGWLPRIEYHVITDESLDENMLQKIAAEIREGKKRFTMAEVNRRIFIKKRDTEVTRIINGYDEKAIVFCASIAHAERMVKSLNLASTFHSLKGSSQRDTWDQNQATLNALKNGIVRRVCAVNAFNEGVNVPSIGLVAFCRVTGVLTIFRQQLGRGLRPGKDKLIVLDFVGNLERIQLVLEMMNKISDLHEQFTPKREIEREGYIRERFEVSGKGFEFTFSDKVVDLMKVLEHCDREFYPTWQEASISAIKLNITSPDSYHLLYKNDNRLPSRPWEYRSFPGWGRFLGNREKKFYSSWQEAGMAATSLGIHSQREYNKKYKEDERLSAAPHKTYSDFPGWETFLGKEVKQGLMVQSPRVNNPYPSWKEASVAARALGLKTVSEYRSRRKGDPRLVSKPERYDGFPGWEGFLGKKKKNLYSTLQEAVLSVKRLGIKSSTEYNRRRKEDSRLPSYLDHYPDFPGWPKYFGKK